MSKSITFVTGLKQVPNNDFIAYCVRLEHVDEETQEFETYRVLQMPLKQLVAWNHSELTFRKIPSHKNPTEAERVYPLDRVAPEMYKILLYNIYTPATLHDMQMLQQTRPCTTYKNKSNYEPNYVLIEETNYTVIAKVYCLFHMAQTQMYNDSYYYNKKGQKSPTPVWFSTYLSAKSKADHIYDSMGIETHYIQMF